MTANAVLNEAAGAVESVSAAGSFIVQAQEAGAALDAISAKLTAAGQLQETVTALEALSATLATSAALLEQAIGADAIAVFEGKFLGAPAERMHFGAPRVRMIIGFRRRVRFGTPRKRED